MTGRLEVDDVRIWFGGVKAVDGISLTVRAGEVHGVVGPNGSGKTTLVNAISGLQPLTGGRLHLDGTDLTGAPAHAVSRAGISRTFQSIKLLPTLTVRENVLLGADGRTPGAGTAAGRVPFGRAARRQVSAAAAQVADDALDRLEIRHLADRNPEELSYGTRRRIEIARALAAHPSLLLLDEPLAGMNRGERAEVAGVIRRLGDEGLTLLVVEHDLRTLLGICDHLFVMNFGRLIAQGPPRETAAGPEVQEAYLGRARGAA
jgi:ABC-type branched-subunit amino acid transport system ATPase component